MKITYDPQVDVLRILFAETDIEESDEESEGVILDYDSTGQVVGIEVLDASTRVDNPYVLNFSITRPDTEVIA